jgi:catalase
VSNHDHRRRYAGGGQPELADRWTSRGPVLMLDHRLMEGIAHFNRTRVPERDVRAKGARAVATFNERSRLAIST